MLPFVCKWACYSKVGAPSTPTMTGILSQPHVTLSHTFSHNNPTQLEGKDDAKAEGGDGDEAHGQVGICAQQPSPSTTFPTLSTLPHFPHSP